MKIFFESHLVILPRQIRALLPFYNKNKKISVKRILPYLDHLGVLDCSNHECILDLRTQSRPADRGTSPFRRRTPERTAGCAPRCPPDCSTSG